MTGLHRKKR